MSRKTAVRRAAVGQRTPVQPRTPRGRRTRQRLIDAAIEVIGERGIAAARVDEIVRRVGCGYGTFYKYFASKIDLVRQVMTDVYQEIHREAFPPISADTAPEETIRVGITRVAETVSRLWPTLVAFGRAAGLDPELLRLRDSLLHRDVDELAQRIAYMEQAGYKQVADPYLVSLALTSMVDEMSRRWRTYEEQIPQEAFVDTLVSVFEIVLMGRCSRKAPRLRIGPLVAASRN